MIERWSIITNLNLVDQELVIFTREVACGINREANMIVIKPLGVSFTGIDQIKYSTGDSKEQWDRLKHKTGMDAKGINLPKKSMTEFSSCPNSSKISSPEFYNPYSAIM